MKRYIYTAMIIAAAAVSTTAQAQQKVNLNKGDQKVVTVELGENDYIAFSRPAGVLDQRLVEIVKTATTKNAVKYTILAKTDDQFSCHMMVDKYFLEAFMREYMNTQLSNCTKEQLENAFSTLLLSGYGSGLRGTQDFVVENGEADQSGSTQFVLGGQDYYIVTCNLVADGNGYQLGNDMSYKVVSTPAAGQSSETLEVNYVGLDAEGKATFSVDASDGIKTLHMVLGTKKSIDEVLNVMGYDYVMSVESNNFTLENWRELQDAEMNKWNLSAEDHYSFLVLGVDNNGDWVKAQVDDVYIKPAADNNCPKLDTESFKVADGALAASYSVASQTASPLQARMVLMTENDWDDTLNEYVRAKGYENPSEAWPDLMNSDKATDVTADVKDGKYNFTKNFTDDERDWYVLAFAVTDANGTTITRTAFHSHIEGADSETITHTYPVAAATAAKKAPQKAVQALKLANGRVKVDLTRKPFVVK